LSRFIRRQTPPEYADHYQYRPFLRIDFLERCAYCERSEAYLRGTDFFTVDHFQPKSKFPKLASHYPNLYYACGKCNQYKAGTWPTPSLLSKGFRFSDPCEEDMYEEHLRELQNGSLEALDNCGRYTCDHIRLNSPDLVLWRQWRIEVSRDVRVFKEMQRYLEGRLAFVSDPAEKDVIERTLALIASKLPL